MARHREKERTIEIERRIKEAVEDVAPKAVAIAYTEIPPIGGGHLSVLAAADGPVGGARRLVRTWEGGELELLVVERRLFESDVRDSALLEAAAGRLLLPYVALVGGEYFARWERLYKRRKIMESLAGIALEHPELSSELLIDPRYFVHDCILRLSHVLPQASELLASLDDEGSGLLEGYLAALGDLERVGIVHIKDGFVAIDRGFVDDALSRGASVSDQLSRAQTLLQGLLKLGLRGVVDLFRPAYGLSIVEDLLSTALRAQGIPRPDRFLHFPTATRLTPLAESTSIDELLTWLEPSSRAGDARLRRFGGVLNEVYLLSYTADGATRRAIVKRYPNWVSLKWAPLALWTLGTKNFAVLGRSRMERECATTRLLSRHRIPVPRILHTSFRDRLLLREYVEGENLADIVKAAIRGGGPRDREEAILRRVGATVAAVHRAGATLGDCKPENFIVTERGDPVIVDLEQGARGGNETWDLAEFLYFSGHYAGPFDPLPGVAELARCFIDGYLGGGGEGRHVADAAGLRYTKVFAPITLPRVIYTVARTCRRSAG